jgi:heat shock protein HslJ
MKRGMLNVLACLALVALAACQSAPAPSKLAGSEWRPVDLDGLPIPGATEAFVAFKEGGELLGNTGCNAMTGTYAEDGMALAFGPIGVTRMMCSSGVMLVEIELLEALEHTGAALREGVNLTLMAADGRVLAKFVQNDWD